MLSLRDLNRTLLARQHLLERAAVPALDMVEHLVGLQAQDNLPPYLSLAARIDGLRPVGPVGRDRFRRRGAAADACAAPSTCSSPTTR